MVGASGAINISPLPGEPRALMVIVAMCMVRRDRVLRSGGVNFLLTHAPLATANGRDLHWSSVVAFLSWFPGFGVRSRHLAL